MARPRTAEELTQAFQRLGVREPAQWAASELNEGINQLGRAAFLVGAWRSVVSERNLAWVNAHLDENRDGEFGVGASLRRLLAAGIDVRDLTHVVRAMQYETLFSIAYLLDDQHGLPVAFGLFELDESDQPIAPIGSLSESALETDPEGLELRSIRSKLEE